MKRKRKKRIRIRWKRVLLLLDALLIAVALTVGILLMRELVDTRRTEREYTELIDLVVDNRGDASQMESDEEASEEERPAKNPLAIDFAALKKQNGDTAAWIYLPDTVINYPVVKYKNNSHYLSYGFNGKKNSAGTLFFDYRNGFDPMDRNLIIYGHRMNSGAMFGSLLRYEDEDYYKAHPFFYLVTEEQIYRADIYACQTVEAEKMNYFATEFKSDEEYVYYIQKAMARCPWNSGMEISAEKSTLTLVTCVAYATSANPRFLVHAYLTPIGLPGEVSPAAP